MRDACNSEEHVEIEASAAVSNLPLSNEADHNIEPLTQKALIHSIQFQPCIQINNSSLNSSENFYNALLDFSTTAFVDKILHAKANSNPTWKITTQ
jgi:hypothetical protein